MNSRVLGPGGALPDGEEKRRAVEEMFDRVAPGYDRMNQIVSLGLAPRWRRPRGGIVAARGRLTRARPRVRDG